MHSLKFPDSSAHRPSVLKFEWQPLIEPPHPRQQVFHSRHKTLHRCLRGFAFGQHQSMKLLEKLGQSAALAEIKCRPVGRVATGQWISRPHLNAIFEDIVDFRKAQLRWLHYGAVQERYTQVPVAVSAWS